MWLTLELSQPPKCWNQYCFARESVVNRHAIFSYYNLDASWGFENRQELHLSGAIAHESFIQCLSFNKEKPELSSGFEVAADA